MKELEIYAAEHSNKEPEILRELTRQTHLRIINPRMISGHIQGQLLSMIVSMVNPKRVLEMGTFTAYSTISMALAMERDSQLITIEIDDELEDIATEYIQRAGVGEIVEQRIGDCLEVIESLTGNFDVVFIDADKRNYLECYERLFEKKLVSSNSVIIADNTLWDGKVLGETARNDKQTIGIKRFNDFVAEDTRVEKVMLPLRDGLTIIRVK